MFRPSSFPQILHWTLIITSDLAEPVQIPFSVCSLWNHEGFAAFEGSSTNSSWGWAQSSVTALSALSLPGVKPSLAPWAGLRFTWEGQGGAQGPAGAEPAPGADPDAPGAALELKTLQTL